MKRRVTLVLDSERDADVLNWIRHHENGSAAIREAIRTQMRPACALNETMIRRILRDELQGMMIAAVPVDTAVHVDTALASDLAEMWG